MRRGWIAVVLLVAAGCSSFGSTGTPGAPDASGVDAASDAPAATDGGGVPCGHTVVFETFEGSSLPGQWSGLDEKGDGTISIQPTDGANLALVADVPAFAPPNVATHSLYEKVPVGANTVLCLHFTMKPLVADLSAIGSGGSDYADLVTIDLHEAGQQSVAGYVNIGLNKNGFFLAYYDSRRDAGDRTNGDHLAIAAPLQAHDVDLVVDLGAHTVKLAFADATQVVQETTLYVTAFAEARVYFGVATNGITPALKIAYDNVTISTNAP
jgi:hypothetical protein